MHSSGSVRQPLQVLRKSLGAICRKKDSPIASHRAVRAKPTTFCLCQSSLPRALVALKTRVVGTAIRATCPPCGNLSVEVLSLPHGPMGVNPGVEVFLSMTQRESLRCGKAKKQLHMQMPALDASLYEPRQTRSTGKIHCNYAERRRRSNRRTQSLTATHSYKATNENGSFCGLKNRSLSMQISAPIAEKIHGLLFGRLRTDRGGSCSGGAEWGGGNHGSKTR